MKVGMREAALSAAVCAVLYGSSAVMARDLSFDATGASGKATDGTAAWDLSTPNWAFGGANVLWSNANPDSAIFGGGAASTVGTPVANVYQVGVVENITVQDITFGTPSNPAYFYQIVDSGGPERLTLNGNVIKSSTNGLPSFSLTNGLALSAGNHTFAVNDSPGDTPAELTLVSADAVSNAITGSGSITLDNTFNGLNYQQYGTMFIASNSSYTGGTNIVSGRMLVRTGGALGTGQTVISNAGVLQIGANQTGTGPLTAEQAGDLTVTTPIKITRSDYSSTTAFSRYTDALVAANDGSFNTITLSGPLDIASTDARITANSNRIIISSTPTTSTGTGVMTLGGDFAGFVRLTADNTSYGTAGGAIKLVGGVELEVSSEGNLGGATSKLILSGGTIHPTGSLLTSGFMTNFGAHNISAAPVNTGLDLDTGTTFTVNNLSGGAIGTRGTGTINFNGTNTFTGTPYFDNGIVNVNGATSMQAIRLRSSTLNVNSGASLTLAGAYISLGADSTGTNGGPDKAIVNLNGGSLIQTDGNDFNVSDNANTAGTINMTGNAVFTTGGITALGKSTGGVGTLNQSGGATTINRNGNFGFVLGNRAGTGNYNLSGGTFTSAGETYVGEGGSGIGNWTQTGGTATVNNWVVVGREGALGNMQISSGTFTKNGGGGTNFSIGEGNNTKQNLLTLSGTGVINDTVGEFWVANGSGNALLTVQDTASLTVNNWFAVGRGGGSIGVVNQSGGTVTKQTTAGYLAIGSGGTGTYNQSGGVLNANGTRLAEASNGTMNLSGGTSNFTGEFSIGYQGNLQGTLNISGTANVTVPAVQFGTTGTGTAGGTINLNGGTLTGTSFLAGATTGTGTKAFNFNGGTLVAAADSTNFIGPKISSTSGTGGVLINTNGHAVTVNSTISHNTALTGADGGLTLASAGTLALTGANTYTGRTTVNNTASTLQVSYAAGATSASTPLLSGGGLSLNNGNVLFNYSGSTTPVASLRTALANGYANNFASGQISSSTATSSRGLGYSDDGTSVVTLKPAIYGDANLDGVVNVGDFGILAQNYNAQNTYWQFGDFNYDGVVNVGDFGLLAQNYGGGMAALMADARALHFDIAAVPEPASLAVLAMAGAGVLRRRRSAR